MISTFESLSMTRIVGLATYAGAAVACAWRWRNSHRSGTAFGVLAAAQVLLLVDIAFNLRWKLHEFFMQAAMARGLYGERRSPQLFILILLIAAAIAGCVLILRRFHRRLGAAIAVASTLLSMALRCAEVLSYHNLDAILYHPVGKIMLVSVLWIGLTLLTCFGVWIDARSAS
jgi:hypothetical protein